MRRTEDIGLHPEDIRVGADAQGEFFRGRNFPEQRMDRGRFCLHSERGPIRPPEKHLATFTEGHGEEIDPGGRGITRWMIQALT